MRVSLGESRIDLVKVLRQAAVLASGSLLLAVGLAMLFLPGPGLAVIFGGLALLATEYAWARRALDRARSTVDNVRGRIGAQYARLRAA